MRKRCRNLKHTQPAGSERGQRPFFAASSAQSRGINLARGQKGRKQARSVKRIACPRDLGGVSVRRARVSRTGLPKPDASAAKRRRRAHKRTPVASSAMVFRARTRVLTRVKRGHTDSSALRKRRAAKCNVRRANGTGRENEKKKKKKRQTCLEYLK